MSKNAFIILGAIIAVYYWRVYVAFENAIIKIGTPKKFKMQGTNLVWIQEFRVINTSGVYIPVTGISLRNYFGEKELGTSIMYQSVTIQPNSETVLPVLVEIPLTGAIFGMVEVLNQLKAGKIQMRFAGTVNAVGLNLPIDENLSYKLPIDVII